MQVLMIESESEVEVSLRMEELLVQVEVSTPTRHAPPLQQVLRVPCAGKGTSWFVPTHKSQLSPPENLQNRSQDGAPV